MTIAAGTAMGKLAGSHWNFVRYSAGEVVEILGIGQAVFGARVVMEKRHGAN